MESFKDTYYSTASSRELRKFGLLVGVILIGFGVLMWRRDNKTAELILFAAGAFLIACGALFPAALRQFYRTWMAFGMFMGRVVTMVILTLSFFVLFTPIAALLRVAGKDFLNRRRDAARKSYWMPRTVYPKSVAEYENQF